MGFWSLFQVATMPILQVLLIGLLGAFLATRQINILTPSSLRDINKVVFVAFTPSLLFASLAKAVTLEEIISWWFMPVNIGLTFIVGGILGWLIVKILRPETHLSGVIIATCSAGNLGNLLLIIVPAICKEKGSPFGDTTNCTTRGFSYASLSAALGMLVIWSYTYTVMKNSGILYEKVRNKNELPTAAAANKDPNVGEVAHLHKMQSEEAYGDQEDQKIVPLLSSGETSSRKNNFLEKSKHTFCKMARDLLSPPNVAAVIGFIVGAVPWLKSLIIGSAAPLRVIQDTITLLGDGTIPCITLILGGNLTQGIRKSTSQPLLIISILCARYVVLPLVGVGVVKLAGELGFLPGDPLYRYVLMLQFCVPPAENISTMAQLFNVGEEECSVFFMWTYLVAAPMITLWSTVYMWMLS